LWRNIASRVCFSRFFAYLGSIELFTVGIETQFKAWHSISLEGTKEPEHEHFWAVEVEVCGDVSSTEGVVISFAQLKARVTNVTSTLSDSVLNEMEYFRDKCPSAENVAVYIFDRLEPTMPANVKLKSVRVSEQVGCWAIYSKS
jgi:6-pyruvoyltetrahydropterin/6-carboxytetrahydropterin synthase